MTSLKTPGHSASSERTLLLVGPKRTGKSSAGNTLLGHGRVFDTKGGGTSSAARAISIGRQVTVVDAHGWGSCEESVPRKEKIELMSAMSLCGPGPHAVLLVIPLLDFTESDRMVVEKRMELLTSAVWRYTMVLFTFGDRLKKRGCSVDEHIKSGGPAMRWLMERCRYRYHVMDNTTAVITEQGRAKMEVKASRRMEAMGGWTWRGNVVKETGRKVSERGGGQQEQVKELLSKVEDMMEENGGWHFSLHMYQRLEEEWSHRELELRDRLETKTGAGRARRQSEAAEMKGRLEQEQRLEIEDEEKESSPRTERQKCVVRKINRRGDEERVKELSRQSSEEKDFSEDGWDTSSDSGVEKEEEENEENEESTGLKTTVMAPCRPNRVQRSAFGPIKRLV